MDIFPSHPFPKLIPVPQWNKHHLWPSIAGLRHLIANAKEKHFEKVVVRAGGRVLINEAAFFEWVDDQKVGSK